LKKILTFNTLAQLIYVQGAVTEGAPGRTPSFVFLQGWRPPWWKSKIAKQCLEFDELRMRNKITHSHVDIRRIVSLSLLQKSACDFNK